MYVELWGRKKDCGGVPKGQIHTHVCTVLQDSISSKEKYKDVINRLSRSGIGTDSDDEAAVYDFKWFSQIHRVMKNCMAVNPPHMMDIATFQPSPTPTKT